MPNFDLEYLELLKNQVADEIAFLTRSPFKVSPLL